MSVQIVIRRDRPGEPVVSILADASRVMGLLQPVATSLKHQRPDIFEDAFQSLEWGQVFLIDLSSDDFKVVYDAIRSTRESLEKLQYPPLAHDPIVKETWDELICAMEKDPRLR